MSARRVLHSGRFLATSALHEMPASPYPHALPVHPHQLEVQEFDAYDLIVDLRPADAFAVDHIPRAVSVPVISKAGSPRRADGHADAATAEAKEAAPCVPYALDARLGSMGASSSVLLYCDQGGAIAADVAASLVGRGLSVDALPGGWASYRRWVCAGVEVLARALDWRWVRSLPGGAAQAVVRSLHVRGEQVLAVSALFESALLPGVIAGLGSIGAPSFESRLVDALRRFDPAVRVWADEALALSGECVLPAPIDEALRHSQRWRVEAPIGVRVDMLSAMFEGSVSVSDLVDALGAVRSSAVANAIASARSQLECGDEQLALATLLGDALDPLYASLALADGGGRERIVHLAAGSPAAIDRLAAQLAAA